jgi:hypothetical protein
LIKVNPQVDRCELRLDPPPHDGWHFSARHLFHDAFHLFMIWIKSSALLQHQVWQ